MDRLSLAVMITCLGSVAVAEDNAAEKDLKSFQGTWKIVSLMWGGRKVVQGTDGDATAMISGNEITFSAKVRFPKAKFKLGPTEKPAAIDLGNANEKVFPNKGIYELKGDMLTVCWAGDRDPRPTKFISTGEGQEVLLVLQRVKK